MNETRTINLNGSVYHIDYDAYQQLRDYLHDIELRLPQDDRQEVMTDIEARVAELFQKALFAQNVQVINLAMLNAVRAQIGEPTEFGPNRRPTVKVNKSQNSGCGRILAISLQVMLVLMALPVIGIVFTVIFALIMAFGGVTLGLGSALPLLLPLSMDLTPISIFLAVLCVLLLVGVPITMLIYTIITYMRTRKGPKARFWWITIILWLLSLIGIGTIATQLFVNSDIPTVLQSFEQLDNMDETPIASEVRALEPFTAIDIQGIAEVTLRQATEQQVTVYANDLTQVYTEVQSGTLYINVPNQRYTPFQLEIAVPNLTSLRATGACEIDYEGITPLQTNVLQLYLSGAADIDLTLHVANLTIDSKGASSLQLEGEAEQVTFTIAGAGEVDASGLKTDVMHINCAGASEAEVYVIRELWAQAAGASQITYRGNPAIKQSIAVGGSSITRK